MVNNQSHDFNDPAMHKSNQHHLVYALTDEIINRLVGYADVHSGQNSYNAEYKQ